MAARKTKKLKFGSPAWQKKYNPAYKGGKKKKAAKKVAKKRVTKKPVKVKNRVSFLKAIRLVDDLSRLYPASSKTAKAAGVAISALSKVQSMAEKEEPIVRPPWASPPTRYPSSRGTKATFKKRYAFYDRASKSWESAKARGVSYSKWLSSFKKGNAAAIKSLYKN